MMKGDHGQISWDALNHAYCALQLMLCNDYIKDLGSLVTYVCIYVPDLKFNFFFVVHVHVHVRVYCLCNVQLIQDEKLDI